ncbi:MAG: VWA domain-containing protein [Acidobacteriota bacterium]|nr:VWA domain-containing protein [Acidobacteriota bacterium]
MRKEEQRAAGLGRHLLTLCLAAAVPLAASCSNNQGGGHEYAARPEIAAANANANTGAAYDAAQSPAPSAAAKQKPADTDSGAETYEHVAENEFVEVARAPLSTFSVDVDTASYSNTRRFLRAGRLPPPDAVRVEELINYFTYDYPQPQGGAPFSVTAEAADCPWNPRHKLVRVGLQGRRVAAEDLPPSNLVFLIDVSGSMQQPNKLPLVKQSLRVLAEQLSGRDRVGVVVYAGSSGLVLPSTPGDSRGEILAAIDQLEAGGSTNGGEGLRLAYRVARENFRPGGINRVVLATDGDFNVGVTSDDELVRLVEAERKGGVSLSVLGFGMGNLKDSRMEKLADKGDGNYAYVDSLAEARKVLGEQVGGTLYTIAKDVKIQVEFNPRRVAGYRLVGYENRLLRDEEFNDDRVDAGEIGAGHTVTALYELVPAGQEVRGGVDDLKYQQGAPPSEASEGGELLTVKLRYKEPGGAESKLLSVGVADTRASHRNASQDFKFAAAVAEFGMLLRGSRHKGRATYEGARELAQSSLGEDARGHRAEFVELIETAKGLSGRDSAGR